jgi:hypothetical protein
MEVCLPQTGLPMVPIVGGTLDAPCGATKRDIKEEAASMIAAQPKQDETRGNSISMTTGGLCFPQHSRTIIDKATEICPAHLNGAGVGTERIS